MRLKFWGMILLLLSAVLGASWVLYRWLARVRGCEKEYDFIISRSGRLPGSRRKKESLSCGEAEPQVQPAAIQEAGDYAATAVMDAAEDSVCAETAAMDNGYEPTAVMDNYEKTAVMEE